ncbi:hypothetical protein BBJ29_000155 [Phytophthora kernoviae]|uniref:Uncharacterized protein n=1 Tax=Phytophthora kernoviae TaxID=325452 RepID=A0A3F2RHA4_9STRA|nr:hypothetical protein BBP00_00007938 [Phytophthora kernoviae]RLN56566.1 hypothetical protein BBP00_00007947 [Phytophthora kernoviae]RLN58902.1 hypothetical protein BBJ29_000145 [Phytophthora kernoviae]RLN58931.1 hypothetical protein BBJ29_000156 [Phytophthora kernoviae]RLN58934.1 hypothetical protein BBJ29_000155 [Phytophthora kernoviae]
MLLKSSARTHRLNDQLMTLRHFAFRKRLQAVCEWKDVSLVLASEWYTSRTDENAAFNILRFVCAGSLQVFEVSSSAV